METQYKCVYIFQLGNETVKIGITNNLQRRIRAVSGHSGLDILRWAYTDILSSTDARQIESDCHKHFSSRRTRYEFFNITFDEACVYLQTKFKSPLVFGRKEKK